MMCSCLLIAASGRGQVGHFPQPGIAVYQHNSEGAVVPEVKAAQVVAAKIKLSETAVPLYVETT
jgi:hypothetical protein